MAEVSTRSQPQRLGDFEILHELGRGGMGIVYEARQISLNRRVALKVMSQGLGLTGKAVQRFRREAETAAKLHHTNIVPIYATGEDDGNHFYAMELIEGPSLDRVLREMCRQSPRGDGLAAESGAPGEPLPQWVSRTVDFTPAAPDAAQTPAPSVTDSASTSVSGSSLDSGARYFDNVARMMAEVADALDHAHKLGVVHRDLKPSNLLLGQDGRLSITDFGLARLLEQPGMTMTGEFVGTPAYMSPEQITAGRIPLDHRTDIYSLGATLYEMLTLHRPFEGARRDQVLAQIIQKEPRPPRSHNRRIPVDLETICLKAMEKDPDRRYQTAGKLADDLRKYLNRFSISARRAGPITRLKKWVRRQPAFAAAAALALVLALAAGYFAYQSHLANQRHIEEKRQRVLENALLAAMNGDFARAEEAIGEAEMLGASTGEIRMLRGMVALHLGKEEEAIGHLEKAVKLLPDSVAAKALLGNARYQVADDTDLTQNLLDMEKMNPHTMADFLFLGKLEAVLDPARGVMFLDKAARLSKSPVVFLTRADVLINKATDTADPKDAELARKDIAAAEAALSDNVLLNITKLRGELAEFTTRKHHGQEELARAALERAGELYKVLHNYPDNFNSYFYQRGYLFLSGQEDKLLALCQARLQSQPKQAELHWYTGAEYYRLGKPDLALQEMEKALELRDRVDSWITLGYVKAGLPDGPAQVEAIFDKIKNRCKAWDSVCWSANMFLLIGDKKRAFEECVQMCEKAGPLPAARHDWLSKIKDYCCGQLSEEDFLTAAKASQWARCEAHYYAGLRHLADRDFAGALDHFEKGTATQVYFFGEWQFCRIFRDRMKDDPQWPQWLRKK